VKFNFQHKEMAAGRWKEFSCVWQMANIGSEVHRAIFWREKGEDKSAEAAFMRALELFDLTLQDSKNRIRFGEIARAREAFADFFAFGNEYNSTASSWQNYFLNFNYLARKEAG